MKTGLIYAGFVSIMALSSGLAVAGESPVSFLEASTIFLTESGRFKAEILPIESEFKAQVTSNDAALTLASEKLANCTSFDCAQRQRAEITVLTESTKQLTNIFNHTYSTKVAPLNELGLTLSLKVYASQLEAYFLQSPSYRYVTVLPLDDCNQKIQRMKFAASHWEGPTNIKSDQCKQLIIQFKHDSSFYQTIVDLGTSRIYDAGDQWIELEAATLGQLETFFGAVEPNLLIEFLALNNVLLDRVSLNTKLNRTGFPENYSFEFSLFPKIGMMSEIQQVIPTP